MFAPNNTEHVSMVWSVGRAGTASSSRCRRNGGSACSRSECGMFACECPTFFPDFFFFRSTRPQINRRSRLRPHPAASGHHPHWQSPYCTTDNDRSVFRCSCRVNGVVQVHGDREEHQEEAVDRPLVDRPSDWSLQAQRAANGTGLTVECRSACCSVPWVSSERRMACKNRRSSPREAWRARWHCSPTLLHEWCVGA